jgi:phosphonate degradation associated HDIG domain protein
MNTVDDVIDVLMTKGSNAYGGECVTQLEHALQCASLARATAAKPSLVAACLLHDFGHLVGHHSGRTSAADVESLQGADDVHQYIALPFLRDLYGDAVLEPIRLHVEAKRYLCHADRSYWASLSPESQRSLEQQGGYFSAAEADKFIQQPFASDAVRLRIWDDLSKVPQKPTLPLKEFVPLLEHLAKK